MSSVTKQAIASATQRRAMDEKPEARERHMRRRHTRPER